ncbi:hypothetical protein [Mesorhizobium sp.]|uniref:hypothetical protein n=1 Tax=Mesorhizobium sp. TaxID=1871066 RepID=UPI000FE3A17F|nr:hypothetical protein [Mesorhizobium sp.]RWO01808.1 MAG: hypothetical protein EOS06_06155 [Mesorhizobium sp.]RWO56003.1 MAG: hypothetical protein EOS13_02760 [Mesorhizobium sp.]TIL35528.1 MAG: hypothetical protein E5Y85_05660 [Mesorhizobium sp.]TIL36705.1 MAG: hypothetical protein E5Y85_03685 [Mesorhizobium sp.]TIL47796.1 MAG: hypothetical protein E5Y86_00865 [Mesorhizobium sp.]
MIFLAVMPQEIIRNQLHRNEKLQLMSSKNHPAIDVTLVCGRRPELLSQTLQSFQQMVFRHFRIGGVYVNIDPFGGDEIDHEKCRSLVLGYFPNAAISEPETASFGRAVKVLWSQVKSPLVLHLEDDWLALESITPDRVFPLFKGRTRAVKLVTKELRWNGRDEIRRRTEKVKLLGLTIWKRKISSFGTSPAFFSGDFARRCSSLLMDDLDPEKQQRSHINPPLMNFTSRYECRVLPGVAQPEIIRDIGRKWRDERGISKITERGRSTWSGRRTTE